MTQMIDNLAPGIFEKIKGTEHAASKPLEIKIDRFLSFKYASVKFDAINSLALLKILDNGNGKSDLP